MARQQPQNRECPAQPQGRAGQVLQAAFALQVVQRINRHHVLAVVRIHQRRGTLGSVTARLNAAAMYVSPTSAGTVMAEMSKAGLAPSTAAAVPTSTSAVYTATLRPLRMLGFSMTTFGVSVGGVA